MRIRKWRRSGINLDRLGPEWTIDCYVNDLMKDYSYRKIEKDNIGE